MFVYKYSEVMFLTLQANLTYLRIDKNRRMEAVSQQYEVSDVEMYTREAP